MKKKRLFSLLLAGALTMSLAACGGQEGVTNNASENSSASGEETGTQASAETQTEEASVKPETPSGQLIFGFITDLEGEFYDTAFNNTATNYKAYNLIHGYETVTYTKEDEFVYNPTVVKSHEEVENEDGTKTYTVTINDGLTWNDGTPITAKDYVFQMLLESSPEMNQVDGYPCLSGIYYVGYEEYLAGETEYFQGVRLVDDMTYSLTVKAEELPFHYDITYALSTPRPLSVIAPGCDIVDSEEGAYISGDFTTELLQETINNPDTGYRYNPQVTCGPYNFVSYDTASRQGVFEVNPNFAGDYRGVKPAIQTLIIKTVNAQTQINELSAGTVDILVQISGGDDINAGLDLVDAGRVNKITYFRNGYGKIQFDCSQFPTDSVNVRQAIAYCLDRNEFARQYSGGYASIVHAAYGLAQWEYMESQSWIDENLNTYEKDIEKAKELLAADGWNKNASGGDYQDGDGLRYKEVDGQLVPLVIEWANTENNPVSDLLSTMLPEAMEQAGMQLNATTMDFPTLSASISHQGDTIYNMYNLATGFASANSPWYYYSTDERFMTGGYNSNWIVDEELAEASGALKPIAYEDRETWLGAWQNYIKVWNEKLPDIPLYSDEYHDFFNLKVKGWEASSIWDWSRAVLDAWVEE
nr:ABC transporter substrate-binding protein [uncultured Acetatifactor sp.]